MICSFRLIPNALKGGESCTLTYQGSDKPGDVLGNPCAIKVFEVDPGARNDLLAEFSTVIVEAPLPDRGKFDPAQTSRTDSFATTLPSPETRNNPVGHPLPAPLKFKPAHFKLKLFGCTDQTHTILIRGDRKEVDGYVYEIGFSISIEGKEVFSSLKMPAILDCANILSENCANAAAFYVENHHRLIDERGFGTHYGSKYKYAFRTKRAFLEAASMAINHRISESWIRENDDYPWDAAEKHHFENIKAGWGLESTSCIDYVMQAMKLGFEKTGMASDWRRIAANVQEGKGQWLAKGLVANGWVALYYNPDAVHPNDDDNEHPYTYKVAKNKKTYGSSEWPPIVPVWDLIVNYRPTPLPAAGRYNQPPHTTPTPPDTVKCNKLKDVIFGFLLAREGKHTAMICKGKVYQVHWDKAPESRSVFDNQVAFSPDWEWNSGLIVVPRSTWSK